MKNEVKLTGQIIDIHELSENRDICEAIIACKRKSGAVDNVPVRFDNEDETKKLFEENLFKGVAIVGEIRTFNNKSPKAERKKSTYVWLFGMLTNNSGYEEINNVQLEGCIASIMPCRETPLGRQICDIIIAVDNNNGKVSYPNVIVWNKTAEFISKYGKVGDKLEIIGRFQSREYSKEGEHKTRVAYEISAMYVSVSERGEKE